MEYDLIEVLRGHWFHMCFDGEVQRDAAIRSYWSSFLLWAGFGIPSPDVTVGGAIRINPRFMKFLRGEEVFLCHWEAVAVLEQLFFWKRKTSAWFGAWDYSQLGTSGSGWHRKFDVMRRFSCFVFHSTLKVPRAPNHSDRGLAHKASCNYRLTKNHCCVV